MSRQRGHEIVSRLLIDIDCADERAQREAFELVKQLAPAGVDIKPNTMPA